MYQTHDRLCDTFTVQRYEKNVNFANEINKKNTKIYTKTQRNELTNQKHTSTLPHYHTKKCVEYLYMSKKSSNFANKLVVESIFEYNRQYMLNIYAEAYIGR